jgi:hypothetical protein
MFDYTFDIIVALFLKAYSLRVLGTAHQQVLLELMAAV